ncbi:hypothetical protein HPB50_023660 [Hyalomma asiaticum]|uniref:Uncharacterized protein n=1 Tax=Hyalomma asiaticum TaxID=266040 RepID=A0ACB7T777_HYAAI|nr:hypothetical protein HPB50_023660 [Hyalomma asiaticum]
MGKALSLYTAARWFDSGACTVDQRRRCSYRGANRHSGETWTSAPPIRGLGAVRDSVLGPRSFVVPGLQNPSCTPDSFPCPQVHCSPKPIGDTNLARILWDCRSWTHPRPLDRGVRQRDHSDPRPLRAQEAERKAGDRAGSEDDDDGGSLLRMSENSLNLCLLGAAAGGMTLGWHIRNHGMSARLLQLMDFPGELYMRMLECLVMPVVASSIVAGLGSVDIMLAGQIGLLAMLYFVVATG